MERARFEPAIDSGETPGPGERRAGRGTRLESAVSLVIGERPGQ